MNRFVRSSVGMVALLVSASSFAQITLYEHEGFRGRAYSAHTVVSSLKDVRFNDTASSIVVERGAWQVCEDYAFRGRCHVLTRGAYPSLREFGLNDRITAVRSTRAQPNHPGMIPPPQSQPDYAYRRRPNERLYQARVTSVRAVYDERGGSCWIDGDRVDRRHRDRSNVGGAILGGILGGIIGHQIGDGSGQKAATAGGAVVGAVIGSQAGRDRDDYYDGRGYDRDLRRCRDDRGGQPQYWDVSYQYRGNEHWARMSHYPGATIYVNGRGEPRE